LNNYNDLIHLVLESENLVISTLNSQSDETGLESDAFWMETEGE